MVVEVLFYSKKNAVVVEVLFYSKKKGRRSRRRKKETHVPGWRQEAPVWSPH